jgi:tRNA(His) 5'-end guanylyltransferase
MPEHSSIGSRIKVNYEDRARFYLTRRTPVIVRVDGRAFHTFTRQFERPFDRRIIDSMVLSTMQVIGEMSGFKLAYIQSDEASFLITDYDTLETQAWFDYNKSKIETISASVMTAAFAHCMRLVDMHTRLACFDARSFNIPPNEVTNYFLWRMQDWHRNSVSMYARAHFSHKQLVGKRVPDMHEMLHEIGRNWATDLSDTERNGTLIVRAEGGLKLVTTCLPKYAQIDEFVQQAGVYE